MKTTHSRCYGSSQNFLGHPITYKTSAPSDVPPFWPCDKENGKTRDLKRTLLSRGLAQQQWREHCWCPQPPAWADESGVGARAQAGGPSLPRWFLRTYNQLLERLPSLYTRWEKTWKQRTSVSFVLGFQRHCSEKNSHLKSKSHNTMCFAPKEQPNPSLSVKHSPLTCLGQDLSINGCQIALTVLRYAVGLMGVEWKTCL